MSGWYVLRNIVRNIVWANEKIILWRGAGALTTELTRGLVYSRATLILRISQGNSDVVDFTRQFCCQCRSRKATLIMWIWQGNSDQSWDGGWQGNSVLVDLARQLSSCGSRKATLILWIWQGNFDLKETNNSRKQIIQFRTNSYKENDLQYSSKVVRVSMTVNPQWDSVWVDGVQGYADYAFLHTPQRQPSDRFSVTCWLKTEGST